MWCEWPANIKTWQTTITADEKHNTLQNHSQNAD